MSLPPHVDLEAAVQTARSLRPNTKRGYLNAVRQWINFAGDNPTRWTVRLGQQFYDRLLEQVSPRVANNMITGGLTFALDRIRREHPTLPLIAEGIDRVRVTDDVDALKGAAASKSHAMTPQQVHALLKRCEGPRLIDMRDRVMVLIGLFTGMRRVSLRSCDLGFFTDHSQYVTLGVDIKGGTRYQVPIDKRAWNVIVPYVRELRRKRPGDGPLFPPIGQPRATHRDIAEVVGAGALADVSIYKALMMRAEGAVTDFHPHRFRHTFATYCAAAGIPDERIEIVTGHRGQRSMVDRFYKDREQLYKTTAAECYEAIIAKLGNLT